MKKWQSIDPFDNSTKNVLTDLSNLANVSKQLVTGILKDTLKDFDDFKQQNKQEKCMK